MSDDEPTVQEKIIELLDRSAALQHESAMLKKDGERVAEMLQRLNEQSESTKEKWGDGRAKSDA